MEYRDKIEELRSIDRKNRLRAKNRGLTVLAPSLICFLGFNYLIIPIFEEPSVSLLAMLPIAILDLAGACFMFWLMIWTVKPLNETIEFANHLRDESDCAE